MNLRLSNGTQINLNELDKLENKSKENALLKFFDGVVLGGNKNNIFDKNEIAKIKAFLTEMAGEDGVIDNNDIKNARLKYSSIFENYTEQNMADDLSLLSLKSAPSQKSSSSSPSYRVKSGDTIKKIVADLGYTGEDAKKYVAALDKQLEADGSYMNDKKWLMAGSNIKLLSAEKLKELGIKDAKPQQSIKVYAKAERTVLTSDIETNDVNTKGRLLSDQKTPENVRDTGYVARNSVARIKEIITTSGHNAVPINPAVLTGNPGRMYSAYKNAYGVEPTVIKDTGTGQLHIFLDTSKCRRGKSIGLNSVEIVCDGKNQDYNVINRHYQSGKIVQDVVYPNTDGKKDYSTLVQRPLNQKGTKRRVINEALPLTIKYPTSLLKDCDETQKKEIKDFIQTLVDKKASLMKDLKMDNDTYDRFAHMALGIAMQETQFGKADSYVYLDDAWYGKVAKDTWAGHNKILKKFGIKNHLKPDTAVSKGLTQIKVDDWVESRHVKNLFAKYGIRPQFAGRLDGKQSAAATIIVLKELQKRVQGQAYQDGMEAARNNFYYSSVKLEDGKAVKNPGGYMLYNGVSEDDAILYLYNGRGGTVRKGSATPGIQGYTHNVARYKKMFSLSTNPAKRQAALKKSKIVTENPPKPRTQMSRDLGWGLGQVIFKPKLYTADAPLNSEAEIQKLEQTLLLKGLNVKNVRLLCQRMRNGELSFAKGLSDSERMSITEQDVVRLLSHGNQLNKNLQGVSDPEKRRRIASSADKNFKQCYQISHARQYSLTGKENESVILNDPNNRDIKKRPVSGFDTGAQSRCQRYLTQLRNGRHPNSGLYAYENRRKSGRYMGFDVERDKGVNYNNASSIDILLAKNASDTANTLRTSGGCLTGAKQSLIGSGAVSENEMRNFNNAFQLAKFLEKHPKRFQEIKYVQISPNVSRELTASDIKNLPAGYIVVFGNSARNDVPGHAGVTNGCGQINADETDNSNWDNFAAKDSKQDGKGEHGYVRVFKLNPDYYTFDPATNKLVRK